MPFRRIIFWSHLVCGVIAGLVIGIMSFTGAALAFEKELTAFAERDARRVMAPTVDAKPLGLAELAKRIREQRPDYRPAGFVISRDPSAAISLSAGGRGGGPAGGAPALYANPYTGDVHEASSPRMSAFLRTMRSWHRWLGVEGEHRNVARAITGACNFAFLGLGVSGLYLWWPRAWNARALRGVALLNFKLSGKARDFNWHNAVGLWSAPVLIVLTATALPMSYQWAGSLIYTLTGTPAPQSGGPGGPGMFGASSTVEVPKPADGAQLLSHDALIAMVQSAYPKWEQITLRLGGAGGGRGGFGGPGAGGRGGESREGGRGGRGPRAATGTETSATLNRESRGENRPSDRSGSGPQSVVVTLKESGTWPRTATTTLSLDPYTGAVLLRAGYAEQNRAQQVRSWTRFLHTGEALGWAGQLVAGLASLGGCVLLWTGWALSARRFFGRKAAPAPA